MADDQVKTRTGSTTSGVGGKDYYPSIGELLEAGPDQFRLLTGKLTKDWLIFLLKDTVEHLKQAKYSNSLFSSINQKLDDIKSVCSSPIASNPQVSPSSPTSWSDVVKKSLNEHDYDVAAADCVLLYNVEERAYDNLGEKAAKEVLNTLKVSSNVVVRANRLGKTNTNKDSKPRPIEVKLTSINDKKLLMSKVSLLKGSGIFVKPKLTWNDRQKEKALLSLRFALVNLGLKRELLRIRDLKVFYDGKVLDENLSADVIFASLRSDLTSSVETSSD